MTLVHDVQGRVLRRPNPLATSAQGDVDLLQAAADTRYRLADRCGARTSPKAATSSLAGSKGPVAASAPY